MHRRTLRTKGKMMTMKTNKTNKTTGTPITVTPNESHAAAVATADRCKRKSKRNSHTKISGNSLAEQLICPLTKQLPIEPVMAEDGRVYERNAIELYFKRKEEEEEEAAQYCFDSGSGSLSCSDSSSQQQTTDSDVVTVLSPYTRKPMGKHLTQAKQHENTIEILIEKGVIGGELAQTWKVQHAAKIRAMETVRNLMFGRNHLVTLQDEKFAMDWYSRDLKGVNVPGVAALGAVILHSRSCGPCVETQKQKLVEGMSYILWAKKRGSILSAYLLGMGCANGAYGLAVNKEKACYWLEKVVNPPKEYLDGELDMPYGYSSDYLPQAQAKLKELKKSKQKGRRSVQFTLPNEQTVRDDHSC